MLEVCPDAERASVRAAELIAAALGTALRQRGRATLALSGGRTPEQMFRHLAGARVAWARVHVFQCDERVVPESDPRRNFATIAGFCMAAGVPGTGEHAMPVMEGNLQLAAERYARELEAQAGRPPVLDVVHLGVGEDGHTASLVPGDPVLDATEDVALTGCYRDTRRMTLTLPALSRARQRIWLVTGARKSLVLARLLAMDRDLVATRVVRADSTIVADTAAMASRA